MGLSAGVLLVTSFLANIGPVTFVYAAALAYIITLPPTIASRESELLAQEFGDKFLRY